MAIRKKILYYKLKGDLIILGFDIATIPIEREKIANTIYEVSAIYGLDIIIEEYNLGSYSIAGIFPREDWEEIMLEIIEAYTEWYKNTPALS